MRIWKKHHRHTYLYQPTPRGSVLTTPADANSYCSSFIPRAVRARGRTLGKHREGAGRGGQAQPVPRRSGARHGSRGLAPSSGVPAWQPSLHPSPHPPGVTEEKSEGHRNDTLALPRQPLGEPGGPVPSCHAFSSVLIPQSLSLNASTFNFRKGLPLLPSVLPPQGLTLVTGPCSVVPC